MTLELTIEILKKGPPKTGAYAQLADVYAHYNPGEIAESIAYIRAELTLEELEHTLESAEAEVARLQALKNQARKVK